jgi:RNA polymerase sigma-70 factor (ECF subfamily)
VAAIAKLAPVQQPPEHPVDKTDFRAIYEREFRYVWNTLRRLGVRDRDIEDVAHDVFVAFYRGIEDYDATRPLKPWLFGIAFRLASDHRRKAGHRLEIPSDTFEAIDARPRADDQVAERQKRELVMRALETLNMDQRAVFIMHDLDGCSMPEIAQVLGAPLNTLYSRLRLGRDQFGKAIKRLQAKRGEL